MGANTDRYYVHAGRGIHAQYDGTDWQYTAQDGLGSVRGLIDSTLGVDAVQSYDPIGNPDGSYPVGFGFTGEQTDANGQVYLRARYYDPSIGVFTSLDPMETPNRYAYVSGNPINRTDPSGLIDVCAPAPYDGICVNIPTPLDDLNIALTDEELRRAAWILEEAFETATEIGDATGACVGIGAAMTVDGPVVEGVCATAGAAAIGLVALGTGLLVSLYLSDGYTGPTLEEIHGNRYPPTPNPNATATAPGATVTPNPTATPGGSTQPQPVPAPAPSDVQIDPNPNDTCRDDRTDNDWDIVYRNPGEGQHPSALTIGFLPKAPGNMTRGLEFHVRSGSRFSTRFISLTRSLEVAQTHQRVGNPIYRINLNEVIGVVYDLTVTSVREEHLRSPITRNFAARSAEVVVEGWVPPIAIKSLIP